MRWFLFLFSLAALCCGSAHAAEKSWKAGAASVKITPRESMWLAGYASRTKPSEGTEQDLYAKALAIEDPQGHRAVLLTSDLIGIPRSLSDAVKAEVKQKLGLESSQVMLTVSHTHCGPVVRDNLADMYPMPPEEAKKLGPYAEQLQAWMVQAITRAVTGMKPSLLSVGQGRARFAINRRNNVEAKVPSMMQNGQSFAGPIDHDVPVLRVTSPDGELKAIVFGYACHNTTLQFLRWCGDYAGYAQEYLESRHKGAIAMYWAGCGGDQNPLPRRTIELCRKYGKELADAVDASLAGKLSPVAGTLATREMKIALSYAVLPKKEQLAADMLSKNLALRKRAEKLRQQLDQQGKIDPAYPAYPVQVWKLGNQVTWVSLGGEVVVDYALRLKKELAGSRSVWVTAYANDVMAYIPSERVLKEGGYEGDSSMIYYGLPSKWAPGLEARIITAAREMTRSFDR